MRILLPAHEAGSGGLGATIRGVIEHVPKALPPADELVVVGAASGDGGWQRTSRRLSRLWREQVGLALAARDVDLLHLPDHRPLLASRTPFLLTVHDLLFVDHPEWFPAPVARYKRLMLRAALAKRPAIVVAVSRYTKDRLLARFPALDQRRVRVIHSGVAPAEAREERPSGGYFVTVSTIEPRKNHLGLLRAFRAARARGLELTWKVAGSPGYAAGPVVAQLRAEPGVEVLGWVSDDERNRLFRGAVFAVYPSLAEGFGLPPLEAMARGVPVACSRGSALDEAAGEAALQVDPPDEGAWTDALLRLASDEDERERLTQLGYAHAALFDWLRAATAYVEAYHDAVG